MYYIHVFLCVKRFRLPCLVFLEMTFIQYFTSFLEKWRWWSLLQSCYSIASNVENAKISKRWPKHWCLVRYIDYVLDIILLLLELMTNTQVKITWLCKKLNKQYIISFPLNVQDIWRCELQELQNWWFSERVLLRARSGQFCGFLLSRNYPFCHNWRNWP